MEQRSRISTQRRIVRDCLDEKSGPSVASGRRFDAGASAEISGAVLSLVGADRGRCDFCDVVGFAAAMVSNVSFDGSESAGDSAPAEVGRPVAGVCAGPGDYAVALAGASGVAGGGG